MEQTDRVFKAADHMNIDSIPVGPLGLIPLKGTEALAKRIDSYLVQWRKQRESEHKETLLFSGYEKDSFVIKASCPRFGTGESKGVIESSVRGDDLYFIVDVTNYSATYSLSGGMLNHYSPDDHFQDLKRLIAAASGSAARMTVIMPFLYEGRQNKRGTRESLDCATMLQELTDMGVSSVITFEAHDPRVQNAIPLKTFETFSPAYQYTKALLKTVPDLDIDSDHMMIVSPDVAGMSRAIFFAGLLGLDIGMFYRRRDYTQIVNGDHPVVALEFLGPQVEGKDVVIVDDMISSGDGVLDAAAILKRQGARRVFACVAFGLFTGGLGKFTKAYEEGLIDRVYTTDLVHQSNELLSQEWYESVDMAKFVALIIDSLNHDHSLSTLLSPVERVNRRLAEYREKRAGERSV